MSARRTRGGDLKDSKEEGGEEAVAMAEAESDVMTMAGHGAASDAVGLTLSAELSSESKKRRVSTKEASNEFLDSAPSTATSTSTALGDSSAGDAGKVGGGTMQFGAAAGQASLSESTAHSEVSVDDAPASVDGVGALGSGSGEGVGDAAATATVTSYKSVISSMARANESNPITAENYYLLHWLCRIRTVSCLRGLRISFLQPDFLWSIYRPMMRSKKLWRTDGDIRVAADLWCFDRAAAEERYGHISEWDVSSVTDMSELFYFKTTFNDNISRWDVSKVTNMSFMFYSSVSFNQHVEDWDVSKVTTMQGMFWHADAFNQAVGDWDMSNVKSIAYMFFQTRSFNQHVGNWDVSKVINMSSMFWYAHSFNQPVGDWNVSEVIDMSCMFCSALAFNQPVGDWNVSSVTYMANMFDSAVSFDQDLTRWDMSSVEDAANMFLHAHAMRRDNKPAAVRDDVYVDDDDDEGEWEEAGV